MYHQKGISYGQITLGGEIIQGCLVGTAAEHGELIFYYVHVNEQNQVRIGFAIVYREFR